MTRLVSFLARNATVVLAVGIFTGLAFPGLAARAWPLVTPAVWGIVFMTMLRVDWLAAVAHARRPGPIAAALVWLLVVLPVAMGAAVGALDLAPGLAAALVLMAGSPPILSSPAFALFIGLDAALGLVVMVLATFLAPFVLPVVALELLGLPLAVGAGEMMLRLGLLIGTAAAAAVVVRRVVGTERLARAADAVDIAAVALLLVFAVAIMNGIAERAVAEPAHVALFAAAAFGANAGMQLAGAAAFAWMGRWRALTAGYFSGNRNMGILLGALPASLAPDIVLFIALAQLPIYILPAVLTPLYRRLVADARAER